MADLPFYEEVDFMVLVNIVVNVDWHLKLRKLKRNSIHEITRKNIKFRPRYFVFQPTYYLPSPTQVAFLVGNVNETVVIREPIMRQGKVHD